MEKNDFSVWTTSIRVWIFLLHSKYHKNGVRLRLGWGVEHGGIRERQVE